MNAPYVGRHFRLMTFDKTPDQVWTKAATRLFVDHVGDETETEMEAEAVVVARAVKTKVCCLLLQLCLVPNTTSYAIGKAVHR